MDITQGMNIEAVRGIGRQLAAEASALEGLRVRVDGLATQAGQEWRGADAQQFVGLWRSGSRSKVVALARELQELARRAVANADAQEATSSTLDGGTAGGGLNSVRSANPAGFDAYRGGEFGRDRDMLDLADASYDHTVGVQHDAKVPPGWKEISADELRRELGIDRDRLGTVGQGFSATLYKDASGNYVLAYSGTDGPDPNDWTDNAVGALAVSSQGAKSVDLARYVKEHLATHVGADAAANLEFTGHSLGGGLASMASIATGNRAVTFNAAGVSPVSAGVAAVAYAADHGGQVPVSAAQNVTNYSTTNDPLTNAQRLTSLPDAFGRSIPLDPYVHKEFSGDLLDGHNLPRVRDAFDRMAVKEEEWYH